MHHYVVFCLFLLLLFTILNGPAYTNDFFIFKNYYIYYVSINIKKEKMVCKIIIKKEQHFSLKFNIFKHPKFKEWSQTFTSEAK